MRCVASLLLGGFIITGCASHKAGAGASKTESQATEKIIVTPDVSPSGKVLQVNESSRFAVLSFPIGTVPPVGQMLNAYRRGLKVAELKVSGPQADENTVADITKGEVRPGDEVRGN